MAKEICISSTPHETRLAILEDDQLAEIYYERENEYTLAGSIYNGRVTRVLPGMQSAFVDIGLERDAFLYVTDFMELEDAEETDEIEKAAASGANQPPREVRHTAPEARTKAAADAQSPKADQKPSKSQSKSPNRSRNSVLRPKSRAHLRLRSFLKPRLPPCPPPAPSPSASRQTAQQDSSEPGAKRWRGRRRRRGGRGAASARGPGADRRAAAAPSRRD